MQGIATNALSKSVRSLTWPLVLPHHVLYLSPVGDEPLGQVERVHRVPGDPLQEVVPLVLVQVTLDLAVLVQVAGN